MEKAPLFDASTTLESLGYHHGNRPFLGTWEEIHWMSTPGPIYCGQTDNCGTGPVAAPQHVEVDRDGFEVIYRQPANLFELQQLVGAADTDPFHGYGIDGNLHWSYAMLKTWWAEPRRKIEQEVRSLIEARRENRYELDGLTRWLDYLQHDLYQYLQTYAFFLDTGRFPQANERLPTL